jgi:hypothetical protein
MESIIATGMEVEPFMTIEWWTGDASAYLIKREKVSLYNPGEHWGSSAWDYFSLYDLEVDDEE